MIETAAGSPAASTPASTPAVSWPPPASPLPRAARIAICTILVISAAFLFTRLGHYPLWYDEALTAMPARNIWKTGDMSAMYGRNIVAFGNGLELKGLKFRYIPPLHYWLAAPFLGIWNTPGAARLPFAICGLGCIMILLRGAARARAGAWTWAVLGLAIIGNVSLFLYSRQCRYYGLVLLLAAALIHAYAFWNGRTRWIFVIGLLATGLMATHYIEYIEVVAILLVDVLLLRPKSHPRLRLRHAAIFWAIQLAAAIPLALFFSPWDRSPGLEGSWVAHWLESLWFAVREANRNAYFPGLLIAAALPIAIWTHDRWLARGLTATAVCIIVGAAACPRYDAESIEVRYFLPLIPLGIVVGVLALRNLAKRLPILAFGVAALAFGANIPCGDFFMRDSADRLAMGFGPTVGFRSLPCEFISELIHPPSDCYTPVIAWLRQHVRPGERVLAAPMFMVYPLIWHAPDPMYCWQLSQPVDEALESLDPANFVGRVAPQYIIRFSSAAGGNLKTGLAFLNPRPRLKLVARFPVFGTVMYRPEIASRAFVESPGFDQAKYGVSVYRNQAAPLSK